VKTKLLLASIILDAIAGAGTLTQIWLQWGTSSNLTTFIGLVDSVITQSGIRECGAALDNLKSEVGLIKIDEQILLSVLALLVASVVIKIVAVTRGDARASSP
jgi:hypothetical protein